MSTIHMPMYEGDSIIRRGLANTASLAPAAPIVRVPAAAPSAPAAAVEAAPAVELTIDDLIAIDRAAHRMRAEAVAALMSGGWKRLVAFIKGDGKSPEEQYLAESTDLVDLEKRQRDLANGGRFRMPLGRPSYA